MPVIRSRDGSKLDWETAGKKMIEIYQQANNEPNIFNDFEYMDNRE